MLEQCATVLMRHVGKFLERLEFEEDIEVQVGILRYLVAQDCEHVFFVALFSPEFVCGIH